MISGSFIDKKLYLLVTFYHYLYMSYHLSPTLWPTSVS